MNHSLLATALHSLRSLAQSQRGKIDPSLRAGLDAWPGWDALSPVMTATPDPELMSQRMELLQFLESHPGFEPDNTARLAPIAQPWLDALMVDTLHRTGFSIGEVLNPSGNGARFAELLSLPDMMYYSVEPDDMGRTVMEIMAPLSRVSDHQMEYTALMRDSFDAVIGHLPHSYTPVGIDPEITADYGSHYILERALDAARPGSVIVITAPTHILDSARYMMSLRSKVDLHLALRLPSEAFAVDAPARDLLVMTRCSVLDTSRSGWDIAHRGHDSHGGVDRALSLRVDGRGYDVPSSSVSPYFIDNPHHSAGTMVSVDQGVLRVLSDNPRGDVTSLLVSSSVPQWTPRISPSHFDPPPITDQYGREEGSHHVADDQIVRIESLKPVAVGRPTKELKALIELRDLVDELKECDARYRHLDISEPDTNPELRQRTREAYSQYLATYGPLNRGHLVSAGPDSETGDEKWAWRRPSLGGFRKDPGFIRVASCEVYDSDSNTAVPSDCLDRPVDRTTPAPARADSPEHAVNISWGLHRSIDMDYIARLLDTDVDQARERLGDLIFTDPVTGRDVRASEYLSGNVRAKHIIASAHAEFNPSMKRNVVALERVMPAEYGPQDIHIALGVSWIDAASINDFCSEVLRSNARVSYVAGVGLWNVRGKWEDQDGKLSLEFGTDRMDPLKILGCALNMRTPSITDEAVVDGEVKRVRNSEEITAAAERINALNEAFRSWVWSSRERSNMLLSEFNLRFRSHVPQRFDGKSVHIASMAPHINLWPWQASAVERVTSSERTLCAHPVGKGKTLSMVSSAVLMREQGIANKPLIAVPHHLLEQVAADAMRAYPSRAFLVAGRDDLTPANRDLFAARCASGDWDAVIMTHEGMLSFPVDTVVEREWVNQERHLVTASARTEILFEGPLNEFGGNALERAMHRFDEQLKAIDKREKSSEKKVTFEQLGIDFIMVDEVHLFRRLPVATNIQGFSLGASSRAQNLMSKVFSLSRTRAGKPYFAGFTGTPWSNTLAETYVWQRFFQPDILREAGLETFDQWASMFVEFVTAVEVAPDGSGFRLNTRPSAVKNVRVLMSLFVLFADFISLEHDALSPRIPTANYETLTVAPSRGQRKYVRSLVSRADAIRARLTKDDNMLLVCNDGRKAALDPVLVGLYEHSAKIAAAAQVIISHYHEGSRITLPGASTPGTFQLVLLDMGTPKPDDAAVYGRLKDMLIQGGVPAREVRFIHEATTDKSRAAMFSACRDGSIRVLIGSTRKVGMGTNVQARLSHLHHIDAPWLPSEVEQREGRALRYGNLNSEVGIYRYVTQYTFDAYMWQTLERKAAFISQLMRGEIVDDTITDLGDQVLSFGEVKALAAGNPRLLEHSRLTLEMRKLNTLKSVFLQGIDTLSTRCAHDLLQAKRNEQEANRLDLIHEVWTAYTGRPHDWKSAMESSSDYLTTLFAVAQGDEQWRGKSMMTGPCGPFTVAMSGSTTTAVTWTLGLQSRIAMETTVNRSHLLSDGNYLSDFIVEWASSAQERSVELRASAQALTERAQASSATIAQARFDQEDRLAQIVEELDILSNQMYGESHTSEIDDEAFEDRTIIDSPKVG